ncbi:MAG: PAS domain-containing protein [Verrucomicrobia bacterium]|nr:PAS domain-containing protein [Verrucomicrobiota bacterium]
MWTAIVTIGLIVLAAVHLRRLHTWRRDRRLLAESRRALAQAEERHREADFQARAQLQTLFNGMVEGVMLLDPAGKVHLLNQSLEHLFNLVLDVRGMTIMEAIRRPELAALVERLKSTRQVVSVEMEINGAPPRLIEVNAASVLDRDGQPQGAILVFHDLTRIRQLESTRREFVANVSHELRTPLSLIKGYAETLLSGAKDNPEVATRFLQKIERHSNRLTNLIEDLLTISRLESGQVTLKLNKVELREFAARIAEDLQGRSIEKGVVIENRIPPSLAAHADLDRLQQVFFNLLDNAIKYGRTGGRIVLDGRDSLENKVQLCVSDDGPGIPPDARERIFERFYRIDKARSREAGGTGLGLSIVKHIVQSHGGEVWVESELGRGASFFFTLPKEPDSSGRAGGFPTEH